MSQSKIKLKICGMRDVDNILEVAAIGPDYMGFIFSRESKRFVGEDFTMPLMPDHVSRVGVFVNQESEEILQLSGRHQLNYVQLHGTETPAQCRDLYDAGLGVIKVFSVGSSFDFAVLEPYKAYVNYFLFDAAGRQAGGNGVRFDWQVLKEYDQSVPFFLAGGLSPDMRDLEMLHGMNLHALDVNSGVEDSPAIKNIDLVKRMFDIKKLWK